MFKTLRNALKIEDIRKKLIFTFLMLVVVRFGSQLPIPGANRDYFQAWFAQQTGDAFNFFDAFVIICSGHYPLHHFLHYRSASDDCNPEAGRDAERW